MRVFPCSAMLLALGSLASTVFASPLRTPTPSTPARRAADFESVRTKLESGHVPKGDPPGTYFHESTFHAHYDGRFASKRLNYEDQQIHLKSLVQTYLSTMNDIGAETWIMHGTLLGWFWNEKIMPWDSDIDVQMDENSMAHLANYYNMTVHHYKLPGLEDGRDYMLEVNPFWVNASTADKANVIDARWIDTDTGLFIDITTLRHNLTAQAEGLEGYMMCKDRHHYNYSDIFPLRESVFENTPVKIPYAYTDLLIEEYKEKALTSMDFENHHFDQETMEWIPLSRSFGGKAPQANSKEVGYRGKPKPTSSKDLPPPRESEVGKVPQRPTRVPSKEEVKEKDAINDWQAVVEYINSEID